MNCGGGIRPSAGVVPPAAGAGRTHGWRHTALAAAVGIAVFFLLAQTTSQHGMSWDEATYRTTAALYLKGELFHEFWRSVDRHPPLVKYLMLLGLRLQPFSSFLANMRFGQLLATATLAAWFFWCVRRHLPAGAALLATAVLLTIPRVFFHMQVAATDGLLAVLLFVMAERFTLSSRPLPRFLWVALLLALALLTKYSVVLMLPPMALYLLWISRRRLAELAGLALACLAAWLLMLALYVPLWPDLWARFLVSLQVLVDHPFAQNRALFAGTIYGGRDTPALYLPVMLLLTTPLPLLAAFVWCWRRCLHDPLARFTLLLTVWVLVFFALPGVPIYDAERQVVFMFPFAVYAIACATARLAARWQSLLLGGLLAANLVPLISDFPHESSYYNALIGGRPGAERAGYDIAQHAEGVNAEVIAWMNNNLPPHARVLPIPMNPLAFSYWQKYGGLRKDFGFLGAEPFGYRLVQNRLGFFDRAALADELDDPTPLFAIRREGVIIVAIYQRREPLPAVAAPGGAVPPPPLQPRGSVAVSQR